MNLMFYAAHPRGPARGRRDRGVPRPAARGAGADPATADLALGGPRRRRASHCSACTAAASVPLGGLALALLAGHVLGRLHPGQRPGRAACCRAWTDSRWPCSSPPCWPCRSGRPGPLGPVSRRVRAGRPASRSRCSPRSIPYGLELTALRTPADPGLRRADEPRAGRRRDGRPGRARPAPRRRASWWRWCWSAWPAWASRSASAATGRPRNRSSSGLSGCRAGPKIVRRSGRPGRPVALTIMTVAGRGPRYRPTAL